MAIFLNKQKSKGALFFAIAACCLLPAPPQCIAGTTASFGGGLVVHEVLLLGLLPFIEEGKTHYHSLFSDETVDDFNQDPETNS